MTDQLKKEPLDGLEVISINSSPISVRLRGKKGELLLVECYYIRVILYSQISCQ